MVTMKKYISFLFAALLLGTSCTDTRTDYMMGDTAYFPKSDLQKETLYVMNANDYVYNVWIHKAGYYQNRFAGRVELDYNYLVQYNTENGTDYEMLDEKYYSFERDFVIEAGADEVAVPLSLKIELLLQDKGYGIYYIPLSVNSRTPEEDVYVDKSHFILLLDIRKPVLVIDGAAGEQRGEVFMDLSKATTERQIDITSKLDINTTEELVVTYGYDKEEDNLLTEDEKSRLLTAGFEYAQNVKIPVGEKYAENYLILKPSEMPDGKWILPVRVGTTNDKVGSDAEENWIKLTVVKGSLDSKVELEGTYVQGSDIILSSDNTPSREVIADVSQISDLSYSVADKYGDEPDWLQVNEASGKLQITVSSANTSTWKERVATITLVDNETWLEKEIVVRQGMKGYGIILNKSLWSVVGYSEHVSGKESVLGRLFDNFWPTSKAEVGSGSTLSYIEISDKGSEENPVQIVFDLGENPHEYNSIGLIPRLQWVGNSPKYLKIEVSDAVLTRSEDITNWILVGSAKRDAFTKTELDAHDGGNWNDWYADKQFVKWHDLGENMHHRYIRFSMWDSWYSTHCFDEIFVSKK